MNYTGHLAKKGNRWYAVINVTDDDGKRKKRWIATGKTKKTEARAVLTNILAEMNQGGFLDISNIKVQEFLERWFNDVVVLTASAKTQRDYRAIVYRHLIPAFGDEYLRRLTGPDIQKYYINKRKSGAVNREGEPTNKPLSPNTIRKHHVVLRQALKQAVDWGLIAKNPTDSVKAPRKAKSDIGFLTPEETAIFLEEAKKSSRYFDIYLLALGTGMRKGEILALHWEDVNLESREITIRRSLEKAGAHPRIKMPKSNDGWRVIDISPRIANMLSERKRANIHTRGAGLVFATESGNPIDPDNLTSRDFDPLVGSLVNHEDPAKRIKRITFHGMRHSHAAHLIHRKESMKVISERLGHSSVSFTMDIYGHLMPGAQKNAAGAIDDILDKMDEE